MVKCKTCGSTELRMGGCGGTSSYVSCEYCDWGKQKPSITQLQEQMAKPIVWMGIDYGGPLSSQPFAKQYRRGEVVKQCPPGWIELAVASKWFAQVEGGMNRGEAFHYRHSYPYPGVVFTVLAVPFIACEIRPDTAQVPRMSDYVVIVP